MPGLVHRDERSKSRFLTSHLSDPPPLPSTARKGNKLIGRIISWIHEAAHTDIVQPAKKTWKREFWRRDIPKPRFTAFRLKDARLYAGGTPKVQTGTGQNGLRWKCWRIRFFNQLGRSVELPKASLCLAYPHTPVIGRSHILSFGITS